MVNPDNGTPNNETDGGTASIKNDENVAATDDSKKSQDQEQQKQEQDEQEQPQQQAAPGEASLLVSEFPPPPSYFRNYNKDLKPPPIPTESLARGTRRAKAAATQVREQAEALRLAEQNSNNDDNTGAILGGVTGDGTTTKEEEAGEVVAVFGEVVEDPYLVEPLDACEDPTAVIEEVQRLNRIVLDGFVQLVQDLVERPTEHKQTREEMKHNIFLMLQECNKFREHQARETLIELLQNQLQERQERIRDLKTYIQQADDVLVVDSATTTHVVVEDEEMKE